MTYVRIGFHDFMRHDVRFAIASVIVIADSNPCDHRLCQKKTACRVSVFSGFEDPSVFR